MITSYLSNAHFAPRKKRASKYADMIAKASRLRHKQTLEVMSQCGYVNSDRLCIRQALNRYISDEIKEIKRFVVRAGLTRVIIVCHHLSREK